MVTLSAEVRQDITEFINTGLIIQTGRDINGQLCDNCEQDAGDCSDNCYYMEITFATNEQGTQWNYQTGDNSFTGGCYSLPHWHVTAIAHDTDKPGFIAEVLAGLEELLDD